MFLPGMVWHWLTNAILWTLLIIIGCGLLQRIIKRALGNHISTGRMVLLGIGGYVLGSISGCFQGCSSVPWSTTTVGDPRPYFQFIYRHTMIEAWAAAIIGLALGLFLVLKRGRKSA